MTRARCVKQYRAVALSARAHAGPFRKLARRTTDERFSVVKRTLGRRRVCDVRERHQADARGHEVSATLSRDSVSSRVVRCARTEGSSHFILSFPLANAATAPVVASKA